MRPTLVVFFGIGLMSLVGCTGDGSEGSVVAAQVADTAVDLPDVVRAELGSCPDDVGADTAFLSDLLARKRALYRVLPEEFDELVARAAPNPSHGAVVVDMSEVDLVPLVGEVGFADMLRLNVETAATVKRVSDAVDVWILADPVA